MQNLLSEIVDLVERCGYLGIFIMTLIEGTFIPIPSEMTIIPAGYLIAKGLLNGWIVFAVSIFGTLVGSLINYSIAYYYGRNILLKYGKYFFFSKSKFAKIEKFFANHGPISTCIGRVTPGLKHFISFPAGLAKMNIKLFIFYTLLGGSIWIFILILLGYFIGHNSNLITQYISRINILLIAVCILIIIIYLFIKSKKQQ